MKVRKQKRGWKKVEREVRYWCAANTLRIFVHALRLVPMSLAFSFTEGIALRLAWHLAGKYREKMFDNLTATYGDSLTRSQKEAIAQQSFHTMLMGFMETFYCVHNFPKRFGHLIEVDGMHNLDEALAEGKGVIAVSAHLGTFTLMGAKLCSLGYQMTWIMGGQAHPRLARLWRRLGKKVGADFIVIDSSIGFHKEIMRSLREGRIVAFLCDEHQKRGGVVVEFLGRTMALPIGPAVYHLKTGAPIVPMFISRAGKRRHRVLIEPPIRVVPSGDTEGDIYKITTAIARILDSYIRRYPGHWSWISKRRIRINTRRTGLLGPHPFSSAEKNLKSIKY